MVRAGRYSGYLCAVLSGQRSAAARLERTMMLEVEGGTKDWFMKTDPA